MLCGVVSVGVIPGSCACTCALGLGSAVGPGAGGGELCDEFPFAGPMLAVLRGGRNLTTSWGRGNCWAEGEGALANAGSTSAWGVVSVVCSTKK
jgi:hypothetical protein